MSAADPTYEEIKSIAASRPALQRAETISEAQTFERVKNHYLNDGLCFKCAAQAAYGHQCGFTVIHPPCSKCAPIVATFPQPAGKDSPWRRWPRGTSRPRRHGTSSPLPNSPNHEGSRYSDTPKGGDLS